MIEALFSDVEMAVLTEIIHGLSRGHQNYEIIRDCMSLGWHRIDGLTLLALRDRAGEDVYEVFGTAMLRGLI